MARQVAASRADPSTMTSEEVNRQILREMQLQREAAELKTKKKKGFSAGRVLIACGVLLACIPLSIIYGSQAFLLVLVVLVVLALVGSLSG